MSVKGKYYQSSWEKASTERVCRIIKKTSLGAVLIIKVTLLLYSLGTANSA